MKDAYTVGIVVGSGMFVICVIMFITYRVVQARIKKAKDESWDGGVPEGAEEAYRVVETKKVGFLFFRKCGV